MGSFRACNYLVSQIPNPQMYMAFEVGGVVPCHSDEVLTVILSILEPC